MEVWTYRLINRDGYVYENNNAMISGKGNNTDLYEGHLESKERFAIQRY